MRRLIAGEFRKLFTTRLWMWLLLASIATTALYASLTIAFSDTPDTFTLPLSTVEGQRTLFAVAAAAAPFAAVLGGIGLTGEFRHGTATATFLATPYRGRVVAAKLVTYAIAGVGYALVCFGVTLAIALPWLSARHIDLVVGGRSAAASVVGVLAAVAVYAIIGVGLGALVREQVATVVLLLIYLFVVENILTSIRALHGWTLYLPGQAQEALVGSTLADRHLLAPWQGGLILAAYGITLAVTGTLLSIRRDVA
jgi:ABC-2 type transport system permease protein